MSPSLDCASKTHNEEVGDTVKQSQVPSFCVNIKICLEYHLPNHHNIVTPLHHGKFFDRYDCNSEKQNKQNNQFWMCKWTAVEHVQKRHNNTPSDAGYYKQGTLMQAITQKEFLENWMEVADAG